jgi:hypothetical protein
MGNLFKSGCAIAILILASAAASLAQTSPPKKPEPARVSVEVTSSPAFAELVLRRTELRSDLEALILEYTEDFPKVKEIRHVLTMLDRDINRLAKVKPVEASRLTLALGKLIVRRIELETDLWKLQSNYQDEHPEVKRAKKKVEIYESSISEILN